MFDLGDITMHRFKLRNGNGQLCFTGSPRMKTTAYSILTGFALTLMLAPAAPSLAQHTGTASGHEEARKACNEEAVARNLVGTDFDDFVQDCMIRAPATQLQQHHQKLATCNRRATQNNLQGDVRARFVDECLRYHPATSATQAKLLQCNQRASQVGLRGEIKKKFVDECVGG